jgi:hypothetical protein
MVAAMGELEKTVVVIPRLRITARHIAMRILFVIASLFQQLFHIFEFIVAILTKPGTDHNLASAHRASFGFFLRIYHA